MTLKLGWGLVALLSGITLGFEIFILSTYPAYFVATSILMVLPWLAGLALLWVRPRTWALGLVLLSLLAGPLLWSGLTTFTGSEVNLPKAGPVIGQPRKDSSGMSLSPVQQKILDYLLASTEPESYLVATLDSHGAAPYILATGRPVLTFGGFNGGDNVITAARLQELVSGGKLRFVLDDGNLTRKQEIFNWVSSSCSVVKIPGIQLAAQTVSQQPGDGPREGQFSTLYDCGG